MSNIDSESQNITNWKETTTQASTAPTLPDSAAAIEREKCQPLPAIPAITKQQPDLGCYFWSSTFHGTQFYSWPNQHTSQSIFYSYPSTITRAAGSWDPSYLITHSGHADATWQADPASPVRPKLHLYLSQGIGVISQPASHHGTHCRQQGEQHQLQVRKLRAHRHIVLEDVWVINLRCSQVLLFIYISLFI